MAANAFEVGVGITANTQQLENQIAQGVERGMARGSKKGLIQGIDSKSYTQPLGRIVGAVTEFDKSMEAANARVLAFSASVAPIFALKEAFDKLVSSTIDVEKSMTDINAIFELSKANLGSFTNNLFTVANQTGQSFNLATQAATEFARQGLGVEETLKRTSAALILNKISGLEVGEAVSSVTSILNGFSKEALSATDVINRMTAVDTKFAVSAGDLAEALKRVGASADDANVSFNQTLALITAARQITGREGAVIGNSLKTVFTRLQRPELLDQLEEAGVKVRDLSGKILDPITSLKNLAKAYDGLAQSQKSSISELIGGVYQINILKGVLRDAGSQVSIFQGAMNALDNSTDATQKRLAILNSTLSAGLVRTMNDLTLASSNVGNALIGGSLKSGISTFQDLLEKTASGTDPNTKSGGAQAAQGVLKGIGNFIAGPGIQVTLNLALKLITKLIEFGVKSGQDFLGLDAGMKEKEALEKRFLDILTLEKTKIDEIIAGKKTIASVTKEIINSSLVQSQRNNLEKSLSITAANAALNDSSYRVANSANNGSFVPNLYSPIDDALRRENRATGGYATLGTDPRLVTPQNPFGLAAIDSRNQKNASEAIAQHLSGGQTISQVKNASSSGGFVPNLAVGDNSGLSSSILLTLGGFIGGFGTVSNGFQKLITVLPQLFNATQKEIFAKQQLINEYEKASKQLTTGTPVNLYGSRFNNLAELSQSGVSSQIEDFRKDVAAFELKANEQRQGLVSTGFKISTAASFGGGAVTQYASSFSPSAGAAAQDLTNGITSAGQALIAFPNKLGKALSVGLGVGGAIESLNTFTSKIDNLRAASDLQISNIQKVSNSLLQLSQTASNLNGLYADNASSIDTINIESRKYNETLSAIGALPGGTAMQAKILSAPDDDSRQGIIQGLNLEQGKKSETITSLINAQEAFASKTFFGLNHVPGFQKDSGYSYENDYQKDTTQSLIAENASVNISNMSEAFKQALIDNLKNPQSFNSTLQNYRGDDANGVRDFLSQIKESGGSTAQEQLIQEMRSLLTRQNILSNNQGITDLIKQNRENIQNKQLNVDDAIKTSEFLKRLFLNQGSLQAGNLLDIRGSSTRSSYSAELSRLNNYQANSALFNETHGTRTSALRDYSIELQQNGLESRNQIANNNINLNRTLVDSLTQSFDQTLKGSGSDITNNLNGEKNIDISESRRLLIEGINKGLTNVLSNSRGNIIDNFKNNNGSFNYQGFSRSVASSSGADVITQGKIEKYLNSQQSIDILKNLNSNNVETNKILQETQQKNQEAYNKFQATLKEANFQQQVNYLGGIQSILNRDTLRSNLRNIERGASIINNPNATPQMKAYGSATFLEALKNMHVPIDTDKNPAINKAYYEGIQATSQTLQKYSQQILNAVGNNSGTGSDVYNGLSQIFNTDFTKSATSMFQSEFKPETLTQEDKQSGAFINTSDELNNVNNSLGKSDEQLKLFTDAISTSKDTLLNSLKNVDIARTDYSNALQGVSDKLTSAINKLSQEYEDAAKEGGANKQGNFIGGIVKTGTEALVSGIVLGIGQGLAKNLFSTTSIGGILGSLKNKLFKSARQNITGTETVATSNSIEENILSSTPGGSSRPTRFTSDLNSGIRDNFRSSGAFAKEGITEDTFFSTSANKFSPKVGDAFTNVSSKSSYLGPTGAERNAWKNASTELLNSETDLQKVLERVGERIKNNREGIRIESDPEVRAARIRNQRATSNFNRANNQLTSAQNRPRVYAERTAQARMRQGVKLAMEKAKEQETSVDSEWENRKAARFARNQEQFGVGKLRYNGIDELPRNFSNPSSYGKFMSSLEGWNGPSASALSKINASKGLGVGISDLVKGKEFLLNGIGNGFANRITGTSLTSNLSRLGIRNGVNLGVGGALGLGANYLIDKAHDKFQSTRQSDEYGDISSVSLPLELATLKAKGIVGTTLGGIGGLVGAGASYLGEKNNDRVLTNYTNNFRELGGGLYDKQLALLNQQKKRKSHFDELAQSALSKQQDEYSENAALDVNYSPGWSKQSYNTLQTDLTQNAFNSKTGKTDLSKLSLSDKQNAFAIWKQQNPNAKKGPSGIDYQYFLADIARDSSANGGFRQSLEQANPNHLNKPSRILTQSDYAHYSGLSGTELTKAYNSSVNFNNTTPGQALLQHEQNIQQKGDLSELIQALKDLAKVGINDKEEKQLEQTVNFSTLPVNINVNSLPAGLSTADKISIQDIVKTFSDAISALTQRVTALDGQKSPAKP